MTTVRPGSYTDADHSTPARWWTWRYARRLILALLLAGAVAGAILGPVSILLGQLSFVLSGGSPSFYNMMYGQAAAVHAIFGVVIASLGSIPAVLLFGRPRTRGALVARIAAGPLSAGGLLVALSLIWYPAGAPAIVIETAIGCAIFVLAGLLSRTARLDPPSVPNGATPLSV